MLHVLDMTRKKNQIKQKNKDYFSFQKWLEHVLGRTHNNLFRIAKIKKNT